MKRYSDIAGDGGSRIAAQVEARAERIAVSLGAVRHRLAIASGKGGVGKSTLTWQLSLALAASGWKVAVLDADVNGPSQARLAGLEGVTPVPGQRGLALPRSRHGVGVVSLGSFLPTGAPADFPTLAPDDSFLWRATQEFTTLAEILAGVEWGELDALLVDLPPGSERTVQFAQFLGADTALVLVTQPSALARGVVERSATALGRLANPLLGYVRNMDGYACPACGEIRPLFPSAPDTELELSLLGSVPFDPELARACDESRVPESTQAGRAVAAIAAAIVKQLESP
jgi:ATP-binding protein involved in chromosome partitioning